MSSGLNTQEVVLSNHQLSDDDSAPFDIVCADTTVIPRDEWLALRREGIGGSDIAAVMDLSPWLSRFALYVDKIGEDIPFDDSEYKKWGNRLEPSIALAFYEETGLEIWHQPVMLRSRSVPLAQANPDRFCITPDGEIAPVEIKNIGRQKAHEWADGPPIHYRLQGQWYLFVTGQSAVYFAVLVGGQDFVIYLVERDDELIAEMLRQAEAFWTLVQLRRPPDVDGSESTLAALKVRYAVIGRPRLEGGAPLSELVARHKTAKAIREQAEAQFQQVDNLLIDFLGDAEEGTVNEQVVVRRGMRKRTFIDVDALRRDYPEIANEYSKATQYRQFSFPKVKEAA